MSATFKTIAFLFYVSGKPSPMSIRHKVSERKSIAKVVSPDAVIERLNEVNNRARAAEERCLLTLTGTSLRFAPYPFVEAKRRMTEAAGELRDDYDSLQDLVIETWPQTKRSMEAFYEELGIEEHRPTDLDEPRIRTRFRYRSLWIPVNLPQELETQMFTGEEQEELRREIRTMEQTAFARKVEGCLRELSDGLETMAKAVREKRRAIDERTIRRCLEAYQRGAELAPLSEKAGACAEQIEAFGGLLQEIFDAKESYSCKRRKDRDLLGMASAVRTAQEHLAPMLDAWVAGAEPEADEEWALPDPLLAAASSRSDASLLAELGADEAADAETAEPSAVAV